MVATDPTASAIEAGAAGVAGAIAAAARGDAQAELAYELSEEILAGQFELLPALAELVLTTIAEGLAAYEAVAPAAQAAFAQASAAERTAAAEAAALYRRFEDRLRGAH